MNKEQIKQKSHSSCALIQKTTIAMSLTIVLVFAFFTSVNAKQSYSHSANTSLEMNNVSVEKVLQTMEQNSENLSQQQLKAVSGKITDINGDPIIGANVIEKDTKKGTVTDVEGIFVLETSPVAILQVSYIGYHPQEISVANRTNFNLVLEEDAKALDEVVVIGYGTVKKSHLTGAVSSVSGKDLQANIARNASSALQGRIAGVTVSAPSGQPGEGMNINVRGISSLSSTAPLYVIDGVYGDINMVDPADIQSIEVLKDASSAAIYGSRAANGVILITTKSGRLKMPTRVSVDAYSGIQSVAKYIDVMTGDQLREFSKSTGYSTSEDIINWNKGRGTDWQRELYHNAVISKVGINASGGNETSTYNLSASYLNQDGIMKTTGYDTWNVRAKNTFSLFDNHLRLGSTVLMKMWRKDFDDISSTSALTAVPMWDPYDSDGKWGQAPSWTRGDNPVGWVEAYDSQRHGVDILLNGYAEVDLFLEGLRYKLNVGINKNTSRNFNHVSPYLFSSSSQNPDYKLSESASWQNNWLVENTLHYDRDFGLHNLSLLAGYSTQRNTGRGFGAGRIGLPAGLTVINAGSVSTQTTNGSAWTNTMISMFGRAMYSYADRYLMSASIRQDGSSKFADGHRWGTFPSASVGWNIANEEFFRNSKDKINELKIRVSYGVLGNLNGIGDYATQSIVTTGLNNVQGNELWQGAITGSNWVSPSNVTWEKTKTLNIGLDLGILNNKLTLNADYFIQNTVDMLLGMPQPGSSGLTGTPTVNAGTVENKGVELSLNYRDQVGDLYYHVGGNATFIKNKLVSVNGPRDEWVGFNPHGKGAVTYAKTGFPIGYFNLIKTDGIFQSVEEIKAYVDKDGKMIQPNAIPGDLKYIDYNEDGKINNNDRQDVGSAFPKMTLGLNMGVEWKGIDFNIFFDGNFGNKIYNAQYFTTVYNEVTANQYTARANSWTESNHSNIPRYISGNDNNGTNWGYTDRWLEDGSFFRLRTLELGYTFPKIFNAKAYLQNIRIYTAMENLFILTKYKGYTPDLGVNAGDGSGLTGGSGVMTRGTDDGRYPTARNITFGLQINF